MGNLKFGIIGAGVIGNIHARVIFEIGNAELIGVSDTNEESGKKLASLYNSIYYSDYKEMLKDDNIDIVCICLPSGLHYQAVMDAAEAKKNVIVEKPIEISVDKAKEMVEKCREKDVKLSVISQHRFDKSIVALKQFVDEGKLGRIYFGNSRTIWYRSQEYYKNAGWRGTWKFDGGGALINQSIHYIDLIKHIMGPVKAVCGVCETLRHTEIETEDLGIALLKFKNGALGTIEGTTLAYPGFDTELNVFGENGSVFIRNDRLYNYKLVTGTDDKFEQLMKQEDHFTKFNNYDITAHIAQFVDVIDAVENNRDPFITGEEGIDTLKIIKAIYMSSEMNDWIEI